jgi:hypothetical protein
MQQKSCGYDIRSQCLFTAVIFSTSVDEIASWRVKSTDVDLGLK